MTVDCESRSVLSLGQPVTSPFVWGHSWWLRALLKPPFPTLATGLRCFFSWILRHLS